MLIFFNKAKEAPWADKISIYAYIQAQIREHGQVDGGSLPDDEQFWAGGQLRWAAGALDGAMGHHSVPSSKTQEVQELVHLLAKQTRKPGHSGRKAVYSKLIGADIGSMIDDVLDGVRKHPGVRPDELYIEAKWLAESAAHRNPVKLGIALLGLFAIEQEKELLLTLGKHDEFTLYAAVAIRNGMEDSNNVLFDLAKSVNGWGKIQIVERLEPSTREIRDWLLRKGCQNSVMNEYLACICARNGNLREALSSSTVDRDLFEGATDIIRALLYGGPAENIDDYEDAPQAMSDYLRLAGTMCGTLKQLTAVLSILEFLTEADSVWERRRANGWTERLRSEQAEACQTIIAQARWSGMVLDAVASGDSFARHYGVICAAKLGIDIWELLFSQLADNPIQDAHYLELMKSENPDRIRRLVQFAEIRLPLRQIATGPEDEMGFGKEYAAHSCLDSILQSLDRHAGFGRELIAAGLNSPVTRNRNMALKALEAWELASWGNELVEALMRLAEIEPNESVRERIQKLREARNI